MSTPALSAPTFPAGPLQVVVGNRRYWAPQGSRVASTTADRKQLSYILRPSGELHAVSQAGEISIPTELHEPIKAKYFPPDP